MNNFPAFPVPILGLFQKRIEGDDGLLELARRRFHQAGLGAEMAAETPEQLDHLLGFRPGPDAPVTAHLSRHLNVLDPEHRRRILEFASRYAGKVRGWVVHDRLEMPSQIKTFSRAARELESGLARLSAPSRLYIEYAAGMKPERFLNLVAELTDLEWVSACIDVGHVGIHQLREHYAAIHPGQDVCSLRPDDSNLLELIDDVGRAVESALPSVLTLISTLNELNKPLHFHLHDGHPLSTFSPFGVSDHLSFLMEIPLGFNYRGRPSLPLMFGPAGLSRIVAAALKARRTPSFTLEIHPLAARLPLDDAAPLFAHWTDKTHAEQMNHWLSTLVPNLHLLREAIQAASPA